MKKKWLVFLLLTTFLSSNGSLGHAVTTAQLDLRQMAEQSNSIFLGTCNYSQSRWDEASRMIFTDSTFLVKGYLKGDLGPIVTITEIGGVLPEFNLALIVPHFPRFHAGEEVILFVWTDRQGVHQVLGAAQGKYSVRVDPATGNETVQGGPLEEFLYRVESYIH
jgi:hypothetical protein